MSRSKPIVLQPPCRGLAIGLLAGCVLLAGSGCTATRGVALRSAPSNPLEEYLELDTSTAEAPSERTDQVLRVNNLAWRADDDPWAVLGQLQAGIDREPSPEKVYALAELAYLAGRTCHEKDAQAAIDLYGASVLAAYRYLFDPCFAATRNPYDPQFRAACSLYNVSLEAALRIICKQQPLIPGDTRTIHTAAGACDVTCVLRGGRWSERDFERIEFASDYEITGLRNRYSQHGLGVPLIAVRRSYPGEPELAKYYPPELSFPVTVFLRPVPPEGRADGQVNTRLRGLLELYDPLTTTDIQVDRRHVPLESDLTTPLAYFLSNPKLGSLATVGLLRPDELLKLRPDTKGPIMGLYMTQPYEPDKIPVVLIHGLWSSPMTWMEMFNDLRSSPQLRQRYQFWFYLYPTAQPFWLSAAQLRRDLAEVRQTLDPDMQQPALDQMVLVGHSMGGLIARLQTTQSRDNYWNLVSSQPFNAIEAAPEVRQKLRQTFFFDPNPSIRRVITIGTPHRGSRFSNQSTQWLVSKLITLPQTLLSSQQRLFRDNPGAFAEDSLLRVKNSIDSLKPSSPIFPLMLAGPPMPWVRYHNIVGELPDEGWLTTLVGQGDGVVTAESAQAADAATEIVVPADHTTVQTHPATIQEVRRILREHLTELDGGPALARRPPRVVPQP